MVIFCQFIYQAGGIQTPITPQYMCWIPAVEKIYRGMSGFVKILPSPVSMGVAKLKRSLEDIPQLKSLDATAVPV